MDVTNNRETTDTDTHGMIICHKPSFLFFRKKRDKEGVTVLTGFSWLRILSSGVS